MPSSPWVPFATLAAAVIAAVTALLAGGLLTARSRLQRRLEKDVAIWDKMPPGRVKDALEVRITRDVAELVVRTSGPWELRALQVGAAAFFGVAAFTATLFSYLIAAADPAADPDVAGRIIGVVVTAVAAASGVLFRRSGHTALKRLIDNQLGEDAQTDASTT